MPSSGEQFILVHSDGTQGELDDLVEELRCEDNRVLADDEVGLVLYFGDLDIYSLKPTSSGEFLAQHVTQISRPRFHTRIFRKQRGATILSVTEDAVFIIRDGDSFKKVRAENLEPGTILATGEKVYR